MTRLHGTALRVTIFIRENDTFHHRPLYSEIVHRGRFVRSRNSGKTVNDGENHEQADTTVRLVDRLPTGEPGRMRATRATGPTDGGPIGGGLCRCGQRSIGCKERVKQARGVPGSLVGVQGLVCPKCRCPGGPPDGRCPP
ncbi:hypothetical protein GCM10010306_051150 [Streptomyces umbrinus]|nr:hypothetical protein GCM10010306_051150 [Streptomyces umbrinus]